MKIKVLGICGSPRSPSNTEILVKEALAGAELEGAETEYISFAGKRIEPCTACGGCPVDTYCVIRDDMTSIYPKLLETDALILGTPVYYGGVSAQLKALMDRTAPFEAIAETSTPPQGKLLRLKVGAAIACGGGRSGGQENAMHMIHWYFFVCDMLPVGITTDNVALGASAIAGIHAHKGTEVTQEKWWHDRVGREITSLEVARMLGRKVAIVAKIVKAGVQATGLDVPKPYGIEWFPDVSTKDKIVTFPPPKGYLSKRARRHK